MPATQRGTTYAAEAGAAEPHARLGRGAGDAAVHSRKDEGGEEEAHAVGDGAHDNEERRGERAHAPAEAFLQELVDGDELAAKVRRDEEQRDDDAPDEIAEDQLEEGEVAAARVGDAGDGDEGDGGGLGGHDGRADRPPRYAVPGEEITGRRLRPPPEPRPRRDDGGEIPDDDDEVDGVQAGAIVRVRPAHRTQIPPRRKSLETLISVH